MTTKMQAEHGADREKCIRMHQEHGENRGMAILMKAELGEGQESNMSIILGDGEIKKQYLGCKMQ